MSESILPFNASDFEKVIEQVSARRFNNIPLPLSTLWNPDTCPTHLLPWLAWALSIDAWDSNWTDDIKRAVITGSIALHRKKGTISALRQVLNAVGVEFEIKEWFQYGGVPHTFQLTTNAVDNWLSGSRFLDVALYKQIREIVDPVKPVRSHYTTRIKVGSESTLGLADKASLFSILRLTMNFSINFNSGIALASYLSVTPKVNGVVKPMMHSQSQLVPLTLSVPSVISLRKKVKASLLFTPNLIRSKYPFVSTQSKSSIKMSINMRVSL